MKFMKFAILTTVIFFISHYHIGHRLMDAMIILFWNTMAWAFCGLMIYSLFRKMLATYRGFVAGLNGKSIY